MKRDFSLFTGLLKTARTDDGMILTGIASSTIKDRHGDTMTPKALESMLRSADGMTIYLNHSYNVPEDVAGTVQASWIDKSSDDLHDLHFQIKINDENPRAVQAFNAIDKGTKLGLSIGAMIPEGGAKRDRKSGAYTIDEVELLETSIVSIPANPRSWVEYARKSLLTKDDVPEVDEEEPVLKDGEDDPSTSPETVTQDNILASIEPEPTEAQIAAALSAEEGEPVEPETADAIGEAAAALLAPYADNPIDATKSKVTVWPSGKVSVDTTPSTSSQDAAPQADPETEESTDAVAAALGEMTRDIEPEVAALLEPTVMASLQTSQQVTLALVAVVEKAVERAKIAEAERDEIVRAASTLTKTLEAFIARVAATPRGRRAIARELPQTAKALEGIRDSGLYSDQFIDILEKGTNP